MKQYMCQCGCGQTGEVSKWWKPSKGMPRYLPHHALRIYHRTNCELGIKFSDQLTPEQLEQVREHRDMNRTKCAKLLNIDKRLLNFVRMELGIHMRDGA